MQVCNTTKLKFSQFNMQDYYGNDVRYCLIWPTLSNVNIGGVLGLIGCMKVGDIFYSIE
jgi:hypothetical protein